MGDSRNGKGVAIKKIRLVESVGRSLVPDFTQPGLPRFGTTAPGEVSRGIAHPQRRTRP